VVNDALEWVVVVIIFIFTIITVDRGILVDVGDEVGQVSRNDTSETLGMFFSGFQLLEVFGAVRNELDLERGVVGLSCEQLLHGLGGCRYGWDDNGDPNTLGGEAFGELDHRANVALNWKRKQ
jgi:hypothetical protein